MKNDNKGFTLLELMFCLGIISILYAIALPQYIKYKNTSHCAEAITDAHHIAESIADYFAAGNITISKASYKSSKYTFKPKINQYSINPYADGSIGIHIRCMTNCPVDYQNKSPLDSSGTGWTGDGFYYLTIPKN